MCEHGQPYPCPYPGCPYGVSWQEWVGKLHPDGLPVRMRRQRVILFEGMAVYQWELLGVVGHIPFDKRPGVR